MPSRRLPLLEHDMITLSEYQALLLQNFGVARNTNTLSNQNALSVKYNALIERYWRISTKFLLEGFMTLMIDFSRCLLEFV